MDLLSPLRSEKKLVSRVGLEPTTRCLRGSCSTIELPAHGNLEIVTRDFLAPYAERRARLTNVGAEWLQFPWQPGAREPDLQVPAKSPRPARVRRHHVFRTATRGSHPWEVLSRD